MKKNTKTFLLTVQCLAVYTSCIEVPDEMSFEEAIQYINNHLNDIPLGELEYVPDSNQLDEENCNFYDE